MGIWKVAVTVIVLFVVIAQIFRYFITIKKLKPSKLSRIFYSDDESFIKSWEKTQEKGKLRFILNNIIIGIVTMGIIGIFFLLNKLSMYGYEQSQTLLVALSMGVIFGLIDSLINWFTQQNRYIQLKEKMESENINNTNKKN